MTTELQKLAGAEIHRLTEVHMAKHHLSYKLSLSAVLAANPTLKKVYAGEPDVPEDDTSAGAQLSELASDYMVEHGVSYLEAQRIVEKTHPHLRNQYLAERMGVKSRDVRD